MMIKARRQNSLLAILSVLVGILVLQNTATVETRLLFFTVSAPRAVLLTATLLIGFALGILVSLRFGSKNNKS